MIRKPSTQIICGAFVKICWILKALKNVEVPHMKWGSGGATSFANDVAEREGFEPSRPFGGLLDFESSAFDHSAISPLRSVPQRDTFTLLLLLRHNFLLSPHIRP